MTSPIRDYIPEGESPTAEEAQRFGLGEFKDLKSGIKPDFVPPEGWELAPRLTQEEQAQAAWEALQARGKSDLVDALKDALKRLPHYTVTEALNHIELLPMLYQQVWYVAEEEGLNRKTLLERLPRPDPELYARLGVKKD